MKKLKMFAVVAGLVVVSAAVFAGKSKFFTGLYIYDFNANQVVVGNIASLPSDATGTAATNQLPIQGANQASTKTLTLAYYTSAGVYSPYYFNVP